MCEDATEAIKQVSASVPHAVRCQWPSLSLCGQMREICEAQIGHKDQAGFAGRDSRLSPRVLAWAFSGVKAPSLSLSLPLSQLLAV